MSRSHFVIGASAAALVLLALTITVQYGLNFHLFGFERQLNHFFASEDGGTGDAVHTDPLIKHEGDQYLLGVGKADITGPIVEINFMGYADPSQVGTGLRQRLFSRAFIIGDLERPGDRFIYLVLDTQSGDTAVRNGVLEGLFALGPEYSMYGQSNVALTGTHSHSGPGAWLNYLLPQITSKGFDKQSYQAIVNGTLLSIKRAHESLSPGSLTYGSVNVVNANINRSPFAYDANPVAERQQYEDNVDKEMTLLRFTRSSDDTCIGALTWFPVHGTSMLGNNTLVSGDNKGVAADMLEKHLKHESKIANDFVAGFSQSNVGDTSPNVLGAFCEDGSGQKCTYENSTCNGRSQKCHGRGPFFREKDQGAKSCLEIGRRQYEAAKQLLGSLDLHGTNVKGPVVKSLHVFQDFSDFEFAHPNGSIVNTCSAALGYSFAAGTTDGPGAFDFTQNDPNRPNANPLWAVVGGFLHRPSAAQKQCHAPKPILLDVGKATRPYLWTPNIVDIQLLRVGQMIMIISPGEATTMAGRRWKNAIRTQSKTSLGLSDQPMVVLGGPANSYTHYIATEEEYGVQRYEGASTLYGPHTLNAYINLTRTYVKYLAANTTATPARGPLPPIQVNVSLSFIGGVLLDRPPLFKSFGDILEDVMPEYVKGSAVEASFVGCNPRTNLKLEDTYAAVEKREIHGWKTILDDSDWDLMFRWTKGSLGTSTATVIWESANTPGEYRLVYNGKDFQGTSSTFTIR